MVGKYVNQAVLAGLANEQAPNPVDASSPQAQSGNAAQNHLQHLLERTIHKILEEKGVQS